MHKGTKLFGKRVAFHFYVVRAGSVGKSIEFDVWMGSHFCFLSIGRHYDGRFWIIKGGH